MKKLLVIGFIIMMSLMFSAGVIAIPLPQDRLKVMKKEILEISNSRSMNIDSNTKDMMKAVSAFMAEYDKLMNLVQTKNMTDRLMMQLIQRILGAKKIKLSQNASSQNVLLRNPKDAPGFCGGRMSTLPPEARIRRAQEEAKELNLNEQIAVVIDEDNI